MDEIYNIKEIDGEKWVIFEDYFNEELTPEIINFLSNYQRVKFGWYFNQPIHEDSSTGKSSILPKSILYLELCFHFNQSVDNLPSCLTHLKFGNSFNQPVDNLPNSLTYLEFGNYFNQPVYNLPELLTVLVFGNNFNQPINKFPNSLKKIEIPKNYSHPLPDNVEVVKI